MATEVSNVISNVIRPLASSTTMLNLFNAQAENTVMYYCATNTDSFTDMNVTRMYNPIVMIAKATLTAQVLVMGTQATSPYQHKTLRGYIDANGAQFGNWF